MALSGSQITRIGVLGAPGMAYAGFIAKSATDLVEYSFGLLSIIQSRGQGSLSIIQSRGQGVAGQITSNGAGVESLSFDSLGVESES